MSPRSSHNWAKSWSRCQYHGLNFVRSYLVNPFQVLLAPVRAGLPVHVVQGERDPFGTPDEVRAVLPDPEVVSSAQGSHSFGRQPDDVVEAVREWLRRTHG